MCKDCGCGDHAGDFRIHAGGHGHHHHRHENDQHGRTVEIMTGLLDDNDRQAAHNRAHFLEAGVLAINLMSSPGSGKTALIEATIDALGHRWRIAVIEGDLETENDAERIRAKGVPAVQITTGQTCHLDAEMVHAGLHALDLSDIDILFIENVGNLVCPADFDLGQAVNVVLLSATEGDDKPAKYPVMFRIADLVLISKADLLPVLDDFDPARAKACVRALANPAEVFEVSARRPDTLAPWFAFIENRLGAHAGIRRQAHETAAE